MKKPGFLPWTDAEWKKWIDDIGTELSIGEFTVYNNVNRYVVVQHPRWKLGEPTTYLYKDGNSDLRNWLWMLWFTPDLIYTLHFRQPGRCFQMHRQPLGGGFSGIHL